MQVSIRRRELTSGRFLLRGGYRIRQTLVRVLIYAVLIGLGFCLMIPFFWMLSSSLKTRDEIFLIPPTWIPDRPIWQNYPEALRRMGFAQALKNTVIITGSVIVGDLLSASLVAYGFARVRFRGKGTLFLLCLSAMMIPGQVTMIPKYILFRMLGWLDTYLPLVVPAYLGGGAFNIFLLRQFFLTVPLEMDDAARIDGCSTLGIFWRIILPLSKPALAAIAIFSFFGSWNDFMSPLIYLTNPRTYTLAVALRFFRDEREIYWSHLMAASLVTMLPCLVLFFFTQKYFIQGVVVSGVKG